MISNLILLVLATNVHSLTISKRMVNGKPAKIEDYPYLVFLGNDDNFCNGAIISRYHVLTAAHCVRDDKDSLIIRAGSSLRTQGGSLHRLESVTSHKDFYVDDKEQKSSSDVAVVRVDKPFLYDSTRQPIRLFDSGEQVEPYTWARAAGWGKNERNFFPRQFTKLDFYIVDRDSCNRSFEPWGGLMKGQICATSHDQKHKFICNGDSGSPLAVGGRLVGVTIYGGSCELAGSPAVYTEVAYFRDWIDQHVTYDQDWQKKGGSGQNKSEVETNSAYGKHPEPDDKSSVAKTDSSVPVKSNSSGRNDLQNLVENEPKTEDDSIAKIPKKLYNGVKVGSDNSESSEYSVRIIKPILQDSDGVKVSLGRNRLKHEPSQVWRLY